MRCPRTFEKPAISIPLRASPSLAHASMRFRHGWQDPGARQHAVALRDDASVRRRGGGGGQGRERHGDLAMLPRLKRPEIERVVPSSVAHHRAPHDTRAWTLASARAHAQRTAPHRSTLSCWRPCAIGPVRQIEYIEPLTGMARHPFSDVRMFGCVSDRARVRARTHARNARVASARKRRRRTHRRTHRRARARRHGYRSQFRKL